MVTYYNEFFLGVNDTFVYDSFGNKPF